MAIEKCLRKGKFEEIEMIHFEQLKNKPAILQCLTGLTIEGFIALLPAFEVAYKAELAKRDAQRNPARQREHGAGQKGALPEIADKLVFILFYFRLYPVQLAQGFFFGMGQPQANDWIHRLSPVLQAALGYDLQLPARPPKTSKRFWRRVRDSNSSLMAASDPFVVLKTRRVRRRITLARRSATP